MSAMMSASCGTAWITCVFLVAILWLPVAEPCPQMCTCTMLGEDSAGKEESGEPGVRGKRVACHNLHTPITNLSQLQPPPPPDTRHLDLSDNSLTIIPPEAFQGLPLLNRLDLRGNEITRVEAGAFSGLDHLDRLDLSLNLLASLNASALSGMPKLTRLTLAGNQMSTLQEGLFGALPDLKRLDVQSDLMSCDCHLRWLVRWRKKHDVRISKTSTCGLPSPLNGEQLRKLKEEDLHCDWSLELPVFEVKPTTSQVVFQGDSLLMECHASILDPIVQLVWVRERQPVTSNDSLGIRTFTDTARGGTQQVLSLMLHELDTSDSGEWLCLAITARGNDSRAVNIFVMRDSTMHCPPNTTSSNKGTYLWDKTVAGVVAEEACSFQAHQDYKGPKPARARHHCDSTGKWHNLDVSDCQYEKQMTRVLEHATMFDLQNMTQLANRAQQLLSFMQNSKPTQDKMDIIFLAEVLQRLLKQVEHDDEIGQVLLKLVSLMMNVDSKLLAEAQEDAQACTTLVRVVENLPPLLLGNQAAVALHAENIALLARRVPRLAFPGLTCATYATPGNNIYLDDSLTCSSPGNHTAPRQRDSKPLEASLHLEPGLLAEARCLQHCQDEVPLQYVVYKNAKLFPLPGASRDERIDTSVISAKIGGLQVVNTSRAVTVELLAPHRKQYQRPVYWDFNANGGEGGWLSQGCDVMSEEDEHYVSFSCSHLTHFAIIQSVHAPARSWLYYLTASLNMSIAVYAGSGVLLLCMMIIIITYIMGQRDLRMPRSARHGIANLALSLLLLCVTFTLGSRAKEPRRACQVMGIAIHYLTLCSFFWLSIATYTLYRKLVKAGRPPPDEPPEGPPLPKPILRFYLVGWGIGMLICGISTAINLNHYDAHPTFCFLPLKPTIAPLLLPVGLLTFICCVLFMLISCVLRGTSHREEEPETEEIPEVDLLSEGRGSVVPPSVVGGGSITAPGSTTGRPVSVHGGSIVAGSVVAASPVPPATVEHVMVAPSPVWPIDSSKLDLEHRPISQMWALVVVLLLLIISWVAASLVLLQPLPINLPHQRLLFDYFYAFCVTVLGIFMLVFYCLGRSDARACWYQCCCCPPQGEEAPPPTNNMATLNGHVVQSITSLNSDYSIKSNNTSLRQNMAQYGVKKPSNINLLSSHTGTFTDNSFNGSMDARNFYNPRQNGVARKYWEKNKHHRLLNHFGKELNTDSGHSSQRDSKTGESKESQRLSGHSGGHSGSDANPHLEVEIQIQTGPPAHSPLEPDMRQSPAVLQPPLQPVAPLVERCSVAPIKTHRSPPGYMFPPPDGGSCTQSGHTSPVPAQLDNGSCPTPPPYSIPMREVGGSHTVPRHTGITPVSQYMIRNGSVPRLRDFDGQSSVMSQSDAPLSSSTPEPPAVPPPDQPTPPWHPEDRVFIQQIQKRIPLDGSDVMDCTNYVWQNGGHIPSSLHCDSPIVPGYMIADETQEEEEEEEEADHRLLTDAPDLDTEDGERGQMLPATDSEGSGSDADIWVLQGGKRKQRFKKETSV